MRHHRPVIGLILSAALAVGLAPVGCKKKSKEESNETASRTSGERKKTTPFKPIDDAHSSTGNTASAHEGGKPELSASDYEKLMFGLSECTLDGIRIASNCKYLRRLIDYRRARRMVPEIGALSAKHIRHKSVPVRVHAATMMRSFIAATDANVSAGLAASATEKHPAVLANMVRALHPDMKTNKDIAARVLSLADHESPLVRGEVVVALVSANALGAEGSLEKALVMIESDSDDTVRERGCRDLGRRVDDRALPLLEKLTVPAMAEKKTLIYNACWDGLTSMFINTPTLDASSEKAFELVLERLDPKTCSGKTPPFRAFSILGNMANPKLATVAPWLAAASGRLHDAMGAIVLCEKANWMARTGAIDALSKGGAERKQLAALRKSLQRRKNDEAAGRLIKKLDAALR